MSIQETENLPYSLYLNRHDRPTPAKNHTSIQETENLPYSLYFDRRDRPTTAKIHIHVHPGNRNLAFFLFTLIDMIGLQ